MSGQHDRPKFRADHVGSLKRSPALLAARQDFAAGKLEAAALRAIEDAAVRDAVARQEAAGLGVVTDGDQRREAFHIDFLNRIGGISWDDRRFHHAFQSGGSAGESPAVFRTSAKIRHIEPVTVADFAFLAGAAKATPKVTLPSPSFAHYRGGRAAVDSAAYPDMAEFFADLAAAYRAEIAALGNVGCRYVQLDEVHFTFFCDPKMVAALKARGDDPDELAAVYARLINESVAARRPDMSIGVHLCRGNRRSSWVAEGSYDPVAERLFNTIDADIFLLEYDTDRAGGFEPLRFVPKDKHVVLGIVTSKFPELESEDELVRRIEEASRFCPLEQLALSPQCGFASSTEGNKLAADDQWRKLERIVKVAERVWGTAV
ncbi:MAG: 5-methyltetrahydropteroyltriglutamate--homocysteine S-methyltransferase [Beijerinckiaceae bacterium]